MVSVNGLGLATSTATMPIVAYLLKICGIGFVAYCGIRSLTMPAPRCHAAPCSARERRRIGQTGLQAVKAMLLVTWLNPLVFVEIVLVCGALAAAYQDTRQRAAFLAGFLAASAVKFFGVSLAARAVSPWFGRAFASGTLNRVSGVAMLIVAASLAATIIAQYPEIAH
jgi:L-lysine exporter family protein LysE/ArgO